MKLQNRGYLITSFYPKRFHIYFGEKIKDVVKKLEAIAKKEDRERSYIVRKIIAKGIGIKKRIGGAALLKKVREKAEVKGESPGIFMRKILEKELAAD